MKPTDTSKNFHAHAHMLFGRDPGGIEAMEARGQSELVHSEVLPTDGLKKHKALLERWGFTIGEPVSDDPLFTRATLPSGWKRRKTDHLMWSEILDEQGRVRLRLFYKAAFYDRRAHTSLEPRYEVEYETASVIDRKTGAALFVAEPMEVTDDRDEYAVVHERNKVARQWADDHDINRDDPAEWDNP